MKIQRGLLLAIEGVDAIGKKTQSQLLMGWLAEKGFKNELLAFPDYSTHIGVEIKAFLYNKRNYPTALEHILFAANRWEKLEQLQATLARGTVLIVNRYTESNLAYGKAHNLSVEWLASLEKGLPKADLVVVLDAPPSLLISRRSSKKDIFETDASFQSRVRQAYRSLAADFGWIIIDATGNVQEIQRRLRKIISNRLESIRKVQ